MFTFYPILLMISGALLIILGAAIPGQSSGARVLNIVFGVGFFGYGFYLEFLFQGGSYVVFYYAFIVPVLLIVRTFQARKAAAAQRTTRQAPLGGQQPGSGPQTGYGAPQFGAQPPQEG